MQITSPLPSSSESSRTSVRPAMVMLSLSHLSILLLLPELSQVRDYDAKKNPA
jgi:hypothetical protein